MEYRENIMAETLSPEMAKEQNTVKIKVSLDDIIDSLWSSVNKPVYDKAVCHHLFGPHYRINVFQSNTYGNTMVGSYFARIDNNNRVEKVFAD
jgi:hypothetical protein